MSFQINIKAVKRVLHNSLDHIRFSFLCLLVIGLNIKVSSQLANSYVKKWKEDINYMHDFIANSHKNPYHAISKKTFDSLFNNLYPRIGKLNRTQLITELVK